VIEGLEADELGDAARARGRYERHSRSMRTIPGLHRARAPLREAGVRPRAPYLDRAEALLDAQEPASRAKVHCDGLRGAALALEATAPSAAAARLRGAHAPACGRRELSASESSRRKPRAAAQDEVRIMTPSRPSR